ncbi:methyltransferase [Dyella sp.]|uniref:class I SAM-dependent methyltransferase n=1 Tax=Dyella sp. TaxID=1869338 RepID=UPI002ED0DFC9
MMKKNLLALALFGVVAMAHADSMPPAYVAKAVADTARPAADSQRDGDRKPAALIAFAGIKPGDKVADVMPGGGYFTRIFSKVVGPTGHTYAIVPESIAKARPQALDPVKAIAADTAYGNVSVEVDPYDRLGAPSSLDVVWTSQNYHDVYGAVSVFAVSGTSGPDQAAALDAAAFKALKPGGVYIVIDHATAPGVGGRDANTLHRIDPSTVVAQVKAAGFVLESRSDLLANPQDAHDKPVFAPDIKGHTDKFVLKFRKPR